MMHVMRMVALFCVVVSAVVACDSPTAPPIVERAPIAQETLALGDTSWKEMYCYEDANGYLICVRIPRY